MKVKIWRILKLQYNLQGYLNLVQMSERKHLLVEGKYDKQFFLLFLYESIPHIKVDIDTAESLISSERVLGNRQKVENVTETISSKDYASKFVGFIDREYDEFDREEIADKLGCHNQISRLVWSRGHSIENYFFDPQIVYESLLGLSSVECFDRAIKTFTNCFETTIRIACALGLTGYEMGKFEIIRSSIHSDLFDIQSSEIVLQVEKWQNSLKTKRCTEEEALMAVNSFQSWLEKLKNVSFDTVRWLCDGHSGIEIIWAVYHCCVFTNTFANSKNEADKIYKVPKDTRFQSLASCLFRKSKTKDEKFVCPYEVLNLFEVDLC